jgi:hypothetical protein
MFKKALILSLIMVIWSPEFAVSSVNALENIKL